jgi:hypothetical protein
MRFLVSTFSGCLRPPTYGVSFSSLLLSKLGISWGGSQRVLNIESRGSSISPTKKGLATLGNFQAVPTHRKNQEMPKDKGNIGWKGYKMVAFIRLFN